MKLLCKSNEREHTPLVIKINIIKKILKTKYEKILLQNHFLEIYCLYGNWKLSYISPIHKEGPETLVTNYRPICIQSTLAKLFERLMLPQIRQAFENIITTKQHGFTGGRSTPTNLFIYVDKLLNSMDSGNCTHRLQQGFRPC